MNCGTCRRELEQGMDVLELQEGVLGNQGLVPIGKALLFCCEQCLKDFFNGSQGRLKQPRRIP